MKITKKLWEDNYEIALLSLNTKFVQGLKNGSLPKNIFQEYFSILENLGILPNFMLFRIINMTVAGGHYSAAVETFVSGAAN